MSAHERARISTARRIVVKVGLSSIGGANAVQIGPLEPASTIPGRALP